MVACAASPLKLHCFDGAIFARAGGMLAYGHLSASIIMALGRVAQGMPRRDFGRESSHRIIGPHNLRRCFRHLR